MFVYKNCSQPESTLSKNHHSIVYHHNQESTAAATCQEGTETNLVDFLPRYCQPAGMSYFLISSCTDGTRQQVMADCYWKRQNMVVVRFCH